MLSSPGAEDSPKAEVSQGFAADDASARPIASDATQGSELLQPGKLIKGRYKLQEQVGVGGLGAVWSATHLGLSSAVALKFLKPELSNHAEAVSRFSAEARACFVLRSEHVVRVLDVDNFEGVPFIVMELLHGTDLRQVLGTVELSVTTIVDYALQVCEGLSAAHGSGIIHRDIKPENLFLHGVGGDARVKVLDFGISQLQAEYAAEHEGSRAPAGTPPYMSPEQLRAAEAVDARSDVWSLGCVLYELATGIAPFERETAADSCNAVLTLEPAPLASLRPDLPEELCAVIERCLQKDPSARYDDAAQLAAALVRFGSPDYVDYPARCSAQLRGERRSSSELSAFRDSQPTAAPVSPETSGEIALLVGTESLRQRLQLSKRMLGWSAIGLAAAGILLMSQTPSAAEPQHIVTPSVLAPKPAPATARAHDEGATPTLHIESLLPAGASAGLEQGRAAPHELDVGTAQATKRKSRHMSRSRYQRRHAQRDPDVGF